MPQRNIKPRHKETSNHAPKSHFIYIGVLVVHHLVNGFYSSVPSAAMKNWGKGEGVRGYQPINRTLNQDKIKYWKKLWIILIGFCEFTDTCLWSACLIENKLLCFVSFTTDCSILSIKLGQNRIQSMSVLPCFYLQCSCQSLFTSSARPSRKRLVTRVFIDNDKSHHFFFFKFQTIAARCWKNQMLYLPWRHVQECTRFL